jgi:hypothetical protein
MAIIIILNVVVCGGINALVASKTNRNPLVWGAVGGVCGPVGVGFLGTTGAFVEIFTGNEEN